MNKKNAALLLAILLILVMLAGFVLPAHAAAQEEHLVINEVLYDTIVETSRPQHEWFEIYNPTASSVDVYGYVIEDNAHRMVIEAHVIIPSGGYLVICNNATAFWEDYPDYDGLLVEEVNTATTEIDDPRDDGNAVPVPYGQFSHEDLYLGNNGDWIKLLTQDPGSEDLNGSAYLVDAVAWEDMPDTYYFNPPTTEEVGIWNPEDADDGYSIQRSPNGQDTNNCDNDFYVYPEGDLRGMTTPGESNTEIVVTYKLTVHVKKLFSGAPIEGVNVTIYVNDTLVGSALTDKNGDAVFQLVAGIYTIVAKRHLFGPIYMTKTEVITVKGDTTVTIKFLF